MDGLLFVAAATAAIFAFVIWREAQDHQARGLIERIDGNAQRIIETDGRTLKDAQYLALCLIVDELMQSPQGGEGMPRFRRVIASKYPDQMEDVATYSMWSTDQIRLTPEAEMQLMMRHGLCLVSQPTGRIDLRLTAG